MKIGPSDPDVLRQIELLKSNMYSWEVIIQVAAAGLNVYHPLLCNGECKYVEYECSGTVIYVGKHVSRVKVGNGVFVIRRGCAEFVVVVDYDVLRIPSGVSLVEAAALPVASRMTILTLSTMKNATPDKTILIHGTSGGFEIIAIQYVKHIGCKVFVVAGTEEKLQICKLLGAEVCINYKKEDFCMRVKAETAGKGVDIIVDASGRDHFQKNLDCLAKAGSLMIVGQEIGSRLDIDLSFLMKKDISIIGVDMRRLHYPEKTQLWSDVVAKLWPLIEDGYIKPIIGKIFTFAEADEACRALEEDSIPGKLLLVPR